MMSAPDKILHIISRLKTTIRDSMVKRIYSPEYSNYEAFSVKEDLIFLYKHTNFKYAGVRFRPVFMDDKSHECFVGIGIYFESSREALIKRIKHTERYSGTEEFDEAKLAVFFTEMTPEIIEYFKTQKLYNPPKEQAHD